MNKLLKSVFKTVVYLLDQVDVAAEGVRDRVSDGADRVSSRVSDLRDQANDVYTGGDSTFGKILLFTAGVGVGLGAALLLAPASGEETRSQIGDKLQEAGERVRSRFSSQVREAV